MLRPCTPHEGMVVLGSGWRTAFLLIPHPFTENHVLLSQQAPLPTAVLALADGTVFTDELTGTKATVSGGQLTLALGENQGMMLVQD